ncbi:hypothetical protein GCM10009765_57800 [Fodinicola feengrottensis]|uniref:Biotin carboxyl carrier protein of acetyl-CoA carboxylase n=1 Tax=Fodinicola feengrottensis TaxID=435914 RepID=A0ABP4UBJ3_9ACTN
MPPHDDPEILRQLCAHAAELAQASGRPLSRLTVRTGETVVELEWALTTTAAPEIPAGPTEAEAELRYLRSPMVGTFYHAATPDSAPFIGEGDVIEIGQPVGILEAMKLMNPVEADIAGRVLEIVVPDGTFVEYDQPLVLLAPAGA